MIVLDASIVFELLLNTRIGRIASERLRFGHPELFAPQLIDLEIAQVLRRCVHLGQLDVERSELALDNLAQLAMTRYPHDLFLERIWALRHNFTAYDAAYVTLAESLDAALWTADKRLAASAAGLVHVEVMG